MGFQSQHYRRVGGFAALASGEDVDLGRSLPCRAADQPTTDDPCSVIGVMMDNPATNADGTPGHSAAPLFHDIAGWLLQRQRPAGK